MWGGLLREGQPEEILLHQGLRHGQDGSSFRSGNLQPVQVRIFPMLGTVLTRHVTRYKAPRPYFHTFEGDEAQIGLNFADEGEADIFRQTVRDHSLCSDFIYWRTG